MGNWRSFKRLLHVDDLADALLYIMENQKNEFLYNIGSGEEISINNLAELIKEKISFKGSIKYNSAFPDGTPRKILDSSKVNKLGWKPKISLDQGIERTYKDFLMSIRK